MDHDVVRLMLRSFTVIDTHLVNLVRENPRYTNMTPEEIIEKIDRKSTRLNSSHITRSRMPSSA